jgi:S1-C subfamily serine protease
MFKRLFAAALAICIASAPVHATDWRSAASVRKSIVQLELHSDAGMEGSCTAFSIHRARRYYMTAAHCIGPVFTMMDGHMVTVLYLNEGLDLAVIQADDASPLRPALRGAVSYEQGQEIAAWGYGYGWTEPGIKTGNIYAILLDGPQEWIVTDFSLIPGQSGGPVIDRDGRVISINQLSDDRTGGTTSIRTMKSMTKKYWE